MPRPKKKTVEDILKEPMTRWQPIYAQQPCLVDYVGNYSQRFSNVLNGLTPEEKLLLDLTQTNQILMEKINKLEQKGQENAFNL